MPTITLPRARFVCLVGVKESREKKDGAKGRLSKALGLRRFHKILPRKEGRK